MDIPEYQRVSMKRRYQIWKMKNRLGMKTKDIASVFDVSKTVIRMNLIKFEREMDEPYRKRMFREVGVC